MRTKIDDLILEALVRKLLEKGILSEEDLRAVLLEAVTRLDHTTGPSAADIADHESK